ncbi:hypothetical protein T484DRAFT_1765995 [Baffinella frigidus]|nr:hypothetical protein T484DRAFT_1765995 [Cryptophyta sp. CCMP2293]
MESALVDAIRAGNIAAVKSLLAQRRSEVSAAGAATRKSVGARAGEAGEVALHTAVAARRPDILALLLREEQARVDAKDGNP